MLNYLVLIASAAPQMSSALPGRKDILKLIDLDVSASSISQITAALAAEEFPFRSTWLTKVMLIRHAEKPEGTVQGVDVDGNDGEEFLIVQGWQRAGALARFFGPLNPQFDRSGVEQPHFLFASGPVSKKQKEQSARRCTPLPHAARGHCQPEWGQTNIKTSSIPCAGLGAPLVYVHFFGA